MRNSNITQLIESWIHVTPDFAYNESAFATKKATSGGNMLGTDTSDPDSIGEEIYNEPQNLPTAVTSILNHVQKRAKFYPAATEDPSELYVRFKEYTKEVSDTPFFAQFENKKVKKKYQSKDYNLLIDGIVSLYDGISSQDKDKLKTSIADMGKSVFGESSAEEWQNLFSQSTIDMTDPLRPRFFLYYTTMYMKYERKKAEVTIQEFSVNKTQYFILPDLIKSHAKELADLDKTTVDQWMGGIDSPQRSGAKLCFDPLAVSVE